MQLTAFIRIGNPIVCVRKLNLKFQFPIRFFGVQERKKLKGGIRDKDFDFRVKKNFEIIDSDRANHSEVKEMTVAERLF